MFVTRKDQSLVVTLVVVKVLVFNGVETNSLLFGFKAILLIQKV